MKRLECNSFRRVPVALIQKYPRSRLYPLSFVPAAVYLVRFVRALHEYSFDKSERGKTIQKPQMTGYRIVVLFFLFIIFFWLAQKSISCWTSNVKNTYGWVLSSVLLFNGSRQKWPGSGRKGAASGERQKEILRDLLAVGRDRERKRGCLTLETMTYARSWLRIRSSTTYFVTLAMQLTYRNQRHNGASNITGDW